MTKRTRLVMSVGVLACMAGMLISIVFALQPTPERALFDQIQMGMPLQEAEGILGKLDEVQGSERGEVKAEYIWVRNDRVVAGVQIDAKDRIIKKTFAENREGWLTKLCRRLGL